MLDLNSDKKYFVPTQIVVQLFVVSVSNILCWIPANCVYITAMFLSRYPVSVAMWTTVSVLPINSLVNPSVFIVAYFRKVLKSSSKKENQKNISLCICFRKKLPFSGANICN